MSYSSEYGSFWEILKTSSNGCDFLLFSILYIAYFVSKKWIPAISYILISRLQSLLELFKCQVSRWTRLPRVKCNGCNKFIRRYLLLLFFSLSLDKCSPLDLKSRACGAIFIHSKVFPFEMLYCLHKYSYVLVYVTSAGSWRLKRVITCKHKSHIISKNITYIWRQIFK